MLGFVTWIGLFLVLVAYGSPIALGLTRNLSPATVRIAIWSGLLLITALSVFINLLVPLRSASAAVVFIGGAVLAVVLSIYLTRKTTGYKLPRLSGWVQLSRSSWLLAGALVLVSAWWLAATTRSPTNYDSGLYHLQAIWYAAEFKAIPGISNLYASYGFGNSLMPLTAVTTNGPMGLDAYRVINGFMFVLLFAEVILRLASNRRNCVGTKILVLGLGVFVAPMIWMADYWVVSPTFDTSVAILTLVSAAALADSLTAGRPRSVDVVVALMPISIAASMRQHYWFLFAFFAAIILWVMLRRSATGMKGALWVSTCAASTLLVLMIARDYILSGWVLYPYKIFAFNVDWVAPDPSALIDSTKLWARSPTAAYQQMGEGWAWVRPWLGANLISWVFLAILGCLIVGLIALFVSRKFWRPRTLLLLALPLGLYLVTWFLVGAPQVRYSWAPLLLVGVLPLAWAWQGIAIDGRYGNRFMKLGQVLIGVELIAAVVIAALVVLPRLSTSLPVVAVDKVPLSSTIDLLVPQGTDQCWSNFPMCSGMPAERIELRGETISDGFRHVSVSE